MAKNQSLHSCCSWILYLQIVLWNLCLQTSSCSRRGEPPTTTSDGGGGKGSVVVSLQWQIIIISTSGSDPADKFDFESAERRANDDLNWRYLGNSQFYLLPSCPQDYSHLTWPKMTMISDLHLHLNWNAIS